MKRDYHVHSSFSDGADTPARMAECAASLGLGLICFCDHCRRDSGWLEEYIREIGRLREQYAGRMDILCAVETKITDHRGALDLPEGLDPSVQRVAAIHRITDGHGGYISRADVSADRERALACWRGAVSGLALTPSASRLAHPFSLLGELGITSGDEEFWRWLDGEFACAGYALERNVKYRDDGLLPGWFREKYAPRMLPGSDSHSTRQLEERLALL